jgi:hypothetical protein
MTSKAKLLLTWMATAAAAGFQVTLSILRIDVDSADRETEHEESD